MSRVQLALNVSDLESAIEFYSKLFGTRPAKLMPGYANFAISDPPLKLVLIESENPRQNGILGALNHLGVEVETTGEVSAATQRFDNEGLIATVEDSTTCCFAVQDKVWVHDPDGAQWEIYTVLGDTPATTGLSRNGTCCPNETSNIGSEDRENRSVCC